MNYPEWIYNSYATYDSDNRTNWIDDMESFADAVFSSFLKTYVGKYTIWRETNFIVVGVQECLLQIRSLDQDQSYWMIEFVTLDEIEVK